MGDTKALAIVALATGTKTEVTSLPQNPSFLATRARDEGGFRVALIPDSGTGNTTELWEIEADGKATKAGTYPAFPPNQTTDSSPTLDGCGALLQLDRSSIGNDTIVRRDIQGTSEVVYDEASMPLVRVHGSYLITGP